MSFDLPKLPYAFDALEPVIDSKTMEIHYTKHHQGYLNKLNAALEGSEYIERSIERLLTDINSLTGAIYTAVRNNGGGYHNHSLFWSVMTPGGKDVSDSFSSVVETAFGSLDSLKDEFISIATGQFGSGRAWLVENEDGQLELLSTPNQDSPLSLGKKPLLGIDVREHAYYLNYQNRRADYVSSWWSIIDRSEVERRYQS